MSTVALITWSQECSKGMKIKKIMYKGSLCFPVFIAICCFLWSAYNKSIENSINIENEWVITGSMVCLFIVTCFIILRLLMTTQDDLKLTKKEGMFWNKIIILFFCIMMLNLAMLMYETEIDGYRKCFLCLVLGLPLVVVLLCDRSSFELHDSIMIWRSRPEEFISTVTAIVVSFIRNDSVPSDSYMNMRNGERIGWIVLIWLFCILQLGLCQKVNDDTSNDVYVSDIIRLTQGSDFRVEIRQYKSF